LNIGKTIRLILVCAFTVQYAALWAQGNNPKFETIALVLNVSSGYLDFKTDNR